MGRFLLPLVGALLGSGDIPFVDLFGDGNGDPLVEVPRRRRRRRMLTASDRGDIAYLAATLGQSAAVKLAAVRLANL